MGNSPSNISINSGYLALGTSNGLVQTYHKSTLEVSNSLSYFVDEVNCLAVLPNGNLVTGTRNGMIRLYNPVNLTELAIKSYFATEITDLQVLDNNYLLSGTKNGFMRIHNPNTLYELESKSYTLQEIKCLAVMKNKKLACGTNLGYISICEQNNLKETNSLSYFCCEINCLLILPNGNMVTGTSNGVIRIHDYNNLIELIKVSYFATEITCFIVSNNQHLVSGTKNGVIRIHDSNNLQEVKKETFFLEEITCLEVMDEKILSCTNAGGLRIHNQNSLKPEKIINVGLLSEMLCWGSTKNGQLGLGGIEEEVVNLPRLNEFFDKKAPIKQIACGFNHTLILLEDGTVYSCGNNDLEQLGHDGPRTKPKQLLTLEAQVITYISAGHSFSLALNNNGQLFCWGAIGGNSEDDMFFSKPTHIKIFNDMSVVQIACGYYHFLVLTEDCKVYVCGKNDYGQLGIGNNVATSVPIYLKSIEGIPVQQIACGGYHSMILTVSGFVFSFGRNDCGQLGFGDTNQRLFPMNLKSLNNLKSCYISCGESFSSVLTADGGVFTFGAGMYGQLGHNNMGHEYLPRKIVDLMGSEITQIACGRCHMIVYSSSNNRIYTFGLAGSGQLGNGSNVNISSPSNVNANLANPKNLSEKEQDSNILYSISAGGDQTFVILKPARSKIVPLDFRNILEKSHILTANIVEDLDQKSLAIVRQDHSKIAVLDKPKLRAIQLAFTSASCLNASFLDQNLHYSTSNRYPGIDLTRAKSIYEIISGLNDDYIKDKIVENLTDLFQKLPDSPPSIEALRLYVTTPFLAEFEKLASQDNASIHSLLYAYAQSINKLKKEAAGRILDYWFAATGVDFFKKLIKSYKNIVINIINSKDNVPDYELNRRQNFLKSSMVFLDKLNRINLEYREIVPYDSFHIPDLIEKIDIKKDYFEWLRRKTLRNDNSVLFCDFPFAFDGRAKSLLLQTDAEIQMQFALNEAVHQNISSIFSTTIDPVNPLLTLFVRREHIVQDTLNQLSKQKRDDLKKPLKVMFIGEDAYDAGGVKKEFFMLLIREILDLKYGMFTYYDETHSIWFNDQTLEGEEMYKLIGELCGLAIYNSIIIDLPFPLVLYKKLLKDKPTLQDLHTLSPSVAKGLDQLLKYDGDDFESVFDLTFEISRQRYDQIINVDLIPGGSKVPVTKQNAKQYVNEYIDYIFNKSVEKPFEAFNSGFHRVCGSKVLELFHPSELMSMVIGNQNYDFVELEKNTEYKGEYNAEHPTIKLFWKVFHEMSLDQKKKFLLFLTGTDRIPILGMKRVKLFIQSTKGGDSFYPVAHTCFNLLDLPTYSNEDILRERLMTAIEHNQGFTIV